MMVRCEHTLLTFGNTSTRSPSAGGVSAPVWPKVTPDIENSEVVFVTASYRQDRTLTDPLSDRAREAIPTSIRSMGSRYCYQEL